MPHLISNLIEKGYTPYTAKLAPRHLWSRPALGKLSPSQVLSLLCYRQKAIEGYQMGC